MKRTVFALSALVFLALPVAGYSLTTGAMFGGFVTSVIPCTCSIGEVMNYIPFFFGAPIPATNVLYVPPVAIIYPYHQLLPGTWELGTYTPTPGVSACFLLAPNPADPCIPVPVGGIVQYTGTSSLSPVNFFGL